MSLNSFTTPVLKLDEVFDTIWNSSDHGHLKNDFEGRTYLDICSELDTDIHECILIDDRAHSIDTSTALGGHGHLTSSPVDTLEYLERLSNDSEAL